MVDSGKAIRELLIASSSVTSLLQTDQNSNAAIYVGNDFPEHFDPKNGPAILISRRGGHAHPEIPTLSDSRVQVKVAAGVEKYLLAFQVYQAVYSVLHGLTQTGLDSGNTLINRIIETTAPQEMTDPDTGWCYVSAFYQVLASDTTGQSASGGKYIAPLSVIVLADYLPGATWGAKVQAADTQLGSYAGEIWVTTAAGTGPLAADVTLSANRKLRFFGSFNLGAYRILVPAGINNVEIEGGGPWGSQLSYSGTDYAIRVGDSTANTAYTVIKDIAVSAGSSALGGYYIQQHQHLHMVRPRFLGAGSTATQTGIYLDGNGSAWAFSAYAKIDHPDIVNFGSGYGIYITGPAQAGNNSNVIIAGDVVGNGSKGVGIYVEGDSNCIVGTDIEAVVIGVDIAGHYNEMPNVRLESISSYYFQFEVGASNNTAWTTTRPSFVTVNDLAGSNSGNSVHASGSFVEQITGSGNVKYLFKTDDSGTPSTVASIDHTGLLTLANTMVSATHTPSSSSDTGVAGQWAWDANFIYICVLANTWKRVAISTW